MSNTGVILVVEDDKFTGRMMELQFRKHGYDIEVVSSGKEALERIEQRQFDLVLSDVIMPNISGLELLRIIREKYTREELPVALITAMEDPPKMNEAMRLGVNDFFSKPKEFGVTLARVEMLLAQKPKADVPTESGPALRASADGLWTWNINRNSASFSLSWKALLGYEQDEIGNRIQEWFDRVHPEDLSVMVSTMQAHQQRKTPFFEADYRIKNKDGEYVWMHSFGIAFFDKTGNPVRMAGSMCRIVTEKKLEQEFMELHRQLQQIQHSMSQLIDSPELAAGAQDQARHIYDDLKAVRDHLGGLF